MRAWAGLTSNPAQNAVFIRWMRRGWRPSTCTASTTTLRRTLATPATRSVARAAGPVVGASAIGRIHAPRCPSFSRPPLRSLSFSSASRAFSRHSRGRWWTRTCARCRTARSSPTSAAETGNTSASTAASSRSDATGAGIPAHVLDVRRSRQRMLRQTRESGSFIAGALGAAIWQRSLADADFTCCSATTSRCRSARAPLYVRTSAHMERARGAAAGGGWMGADGAHGMVRVGARTTPFRSRSCTTWRARNDACRPSRCLARFERALRGLGGRSDGAQVD